MNSTLIGVEGALQADLGFIELSDPESFFDTLWLGDPPVMFKAKFGTVDAIAVLPRLTIRLAHFRTRCCPSSLSTCDSTRQLSSHWVHVKVVGC
ncbi:hypothetical protein SAMN04488039_103259 [Sulfitobacter dubius]|nr:hypothetical protein SAMN04488039_103259 [Sulfitobacter dubius]